MHRRNVRLDEVKQAPVEPDKAEVLWCATSRRQNQLPTTALLIDGTAAVDPVKSVRDLGIYIDSDLDMRTGTARYT